MKTRILSRILYGIVGAFLACAGTISFAQTTRPAIDFAGDPRMGTCTHFAQGWDYKKVMPLIEKSGIQWIRDDFDWTATEKVKGVYKIPEWTANWIHGAHAHHLRVLLILNGSNKLYADHYDPQAFAKWAAWAVGELHNDIDAVEILNEPNNFGFSKYYGGTHEGEGDSPWVAKYVTLMNTAAEAIKAVDPTMPVIGFGAGAPVTYKQLALGTSPAVDAIADHPYSDHTQPEIIPAPSLDDQMKRFGFTTTDARSSFVSLIQGFRAQSVKHHGPKGLWLTEWGYTTYQPLTVGHFTGFNEEAQAKYILRRFAECMGLGVDVSVLYEFSDGRDDHDAESRWGLVRFNGEPKPSYDAVVNLSAAMRGFRVPREGEVGAVNVFPASSWPDQAPVAAYRFINEQGRPAVAIWATDRANSDLQPRVADVELLWGDGVKGLTAVDTLTGNSKAVAFKHSGGRIMIESMIVRDYPVLIEAAGPAGAGGAVADGVKNLGLFVKGTAWGFSRGEEFPGAAGTFALAEDGDKPVGALSFDFTKGGAYVAAQTHVAIPNQTAELRVGVKSSQRVGMSVRLVDVTGQCHQFAESCSGTGAWETLRVALDHKASEHWGGANDGRIHFPIHELSICVGKPSANKIGTVQFSDVATVAK